VSGRARRQMRAAAAIASEPQALAKRGDAGERHLAPKRRRSGRCDLARAVRDILRQAHIGQNAKWQRTQLRRHISIRCVATTTRGLTRKILLLPSKRCPRRCASRAPQIRRPAQKLSARNSVQLECPHVGHRLPFFHRRACSRRCGEKRHCIT
jgi:hypothetical protein